MRRPGARLRLRRRPAQHHRARLRERGGRPGAQPQPRPPARGGHPRPARPARRARLRGDPAGPRRRHHLPRPALQPPRRDRARRADRLPGRDDRGAAHQVRPGRHAAGLGRDHAHAHVVRGLVLRPEGRGVRGAAQRAARRDRLGHRRAAQQRLDPQLPADVRDPGRDAAVRLDRRGRRPVLLRRLGQLRDLRDHVPALLRPLPRAGPRGRERRLHGLHGLHRGLDDRPHRPLQVEQRERRARRRTGRSPAATAGPTAARPRAATARAARPPAPIRTPARRSG